MLHLVFQVALDDGILQRIGFEDVVILLDDAVFRSLQRGKRADALSKLLKRTKCLVLKEHLAIRGIAIAELVEGIEVIDYTEFVNLTVEHAQIQTWN